MKLPIVNTSNNPLPAYETKNSAGMDLRAYLPEGPITLEPMQRSLVPTGLYMEIPEGYEGQVRPRSGLALKSGITVLNSPGTALGLRKNFHLHDFGLLAFGDDHLRNAVATIDDERFVGEINKNDANLPTIVGVDGAW